MSPDFLDAVLTTMLPGGEVGSGRVLPDPAALGLGSRLADHLGAHPWRVQLAEALAAIAAEAGGEAAFVAADATRRTELLRRAEQAESQPFGLLVHIAVADFYDHPQVVTAFGWRAAPPQPTGHTLDPLDPELLAPVRARGPIWRSV